jgi:pteridine reductase
VADDDHPVALVTGGGRRLGAAIGRHLHRAGLRLVVHHRGSAGDAAARAGELERERPRSVRLVQADLRRADDIVTMAGRALDAFGRLDYLVNNASSFYPTPLESATHDDFDDLFGTNVRAPFFLIQALAAELRRRRGAVVNLADIYADRPLASHPLYCAAKAALVSLTRSLARHLAPDVRVNAVAPGAILWPDNDGAEDSRERIVARTPLKRMGERADIASSVAYLLLDAPFVTGHVLTVDGGRSIVP